MEGADTLYTVSRLFPSLFPSRRTLERCASILASLESADGDSLRYLYRKGLLYRIGAGKGGGEGRGRYTLYRPTPRGMIIAILSNPSSFRDNRVVMNALADVAYRGNRLALALVLIGLVDARDGSIYSTLVDYSKHHTMDGPDEEVADSLMGFMGSRLEDDARGLQGYINVLRDFTSSTLDNVLRVVIASLRPRVEDYNGFIQLMHEVVRFYYDPVRVAYMRVVGEREEFRERLERFRVEHDISVLAGSERGTLEVSLRLPSHSRLASLPYYMQVIAYKLIVEPREFMLRELERYVWGS
ncbi:MAG: hypothetical protein NZ888_01970 [Candidatus Nitrosocaldus sp.]|nr:hypothetical protein [Candidatus Nitrosocaldus sp.]MDW7999986.1 hypothetical protein [Candidatus Nitrosocaldus sp.]